MQPRSPASELVGITLDGGFKVVKPFEKNESHTDGQQSHCYLAERGGQTYFLKALDITFTDSTTLAVDIESGLRAYNFERELLELAKEAKLSRIVRIVTAGQYGFDLGPIKVPVFYLIFECADDNLRRLLADAEKATPSVKLRALHHIATGITQLHAQFVAHQDLKPSNVLQYGNDASTSQFKIGDLGRASKAGRKADHDEYVTPGDLRYQTLEQYYRLVLEDFHYRRFACDIYLIGAMLVLMFTGVSITQRVLAGVPKEYKKPHWGGAYTDALPFVRHAFDHTVSDLEASWPFRHELPKFAEELSAMVRYLCEPDPQLRGHPRAIRRKSPFELEFTISELNRLSSQASHLERTEELRSTSKLTQVYK